MHQVTCSVIDCPKRALARGWCGAHYQSWRRHGDPLAAGTSPGSVLAYYHANLMTRVIDCKLWPYASRNGYGVVVLNGRPRPVSVLACEAFNGPAPSAEMEAAHGYNGRCKSTLCWNGAHLSWKSHQDNLHDKIRDGTLLLGSAHQNAKLSESDVITLRKLYGTGMWTQSELAREVGVKRQTVGDILTRRTWAHVE